MSYTFQVSDIFEFKHFESLSAFVDYCDAGIAEDERRLSQLSSQTGTHKFTATADYAEASRLIRNGWPKGVRNLERILQIISQGIGQLETREAVYDVCGPIAVTGAYCAGDPECMLNPAEVLERPVVNLLVDSTASCHVKAANIVNRGAAILALAQQLENAGRRVAVYMSNVTRFHDIDGMPHPNNAAHLSIVCIKQPEHDFNLHSLSYAMTCPSFLRRHIFRLHERCQRIPDPHQQAYGAPCNLTAIEGVANMIGRIDLYFPSITFCEDAVNTPERATDYVLRLAKEAAVIA